MKKIINYLLSFLCLTFFLGCSIENENNADFIESITDPINISADVSIDEATGLVTVYPFGEGVVLFNIDFGDGSVLYESINPGSSINYAYIEAGDYVITIFGLGLNGATTQTSVEIEVPFIIPADLAIENFEGEVPDSFNFGGVANVQVILNPDPTGENTTENVIEFLKTDGAEVWGGMGISIEALDFDTTNLIQLKSYSPEAGKTIKVKLETIAGNVAGLTYEVDLITSVANQWETLVYDFSGAPDLEYVSFIVFYDYGNSGNGSIYRFDEIQLID